MMQNRPPDRSQVMASLLAFAAHNAPYYRDQAWASGVRAGKPLRFADLPITPKQDVKDQVEQFYAQRVPASEGQILEKYTSGSTGVALRVLKTKRHFAINTEENQRLADGWGRGEYKTVVHTSYAEQGHEAGSVTETVGANDFHHWRVYSFASPLVADLLEKTRAPHFNSRPSVVLGALLEDKDFSFLRLISTVSEIIPPELRVLVSKLPDCRLFDSYGTVETGILASACAICGQYHTAAGHAHIEVLKDGRPAQPGEMGKVVVTPLFNLAMPLIRYDLEDYVEIAAPGGCERPGLTFSKIIGRERNLFTLPEGGRVTPNIPPEDVLALGIRQYKLIQRTLTEVDLLYVPQSPAIEISQGVAQRLVDENLSPGIRASVHKVAEMPLSLGGKFLMHESLL